MPEVPNDIKPSLEPRQLNSINIQNRLIQLWALSQTGDGFNPKLATRIAAEIGIDHSPTPSQGEILEITRTAFEAYPTEAAEILANVAASENSPHTDQAPPISLNSRPVEEKGGRDYGREIGAPEY